MSKEWKPKKGEEVLVWDHDRQTPRKGMFAVEYNGLYYVENGFDLLHWRHIGQIKKTVRDWVNELPDGYRERALKNTPDKILEKEMSSWLIWPYSNYSFVWSKSPEGLSFWTDTHLAKKDGTEYPELPPKVKLDTRRVAGWHVYVEGWTVLCEATRPHIKGESILIDRGYASVKDIADGGYTFSQDPLKPLDQWQTLEAICAEAGR